MTDVDIHISTIMVTSILVRLEPSGHAISKSGRFEFSITLKATTDSAETITIDPFPTVLDSKADAFGYQGFTFQHEDGRFAPRPRLHVNYMLPDFLAPGAVVEIPPLHSGEPFSITFAMNFAKCDRGDEGYRRQVDSITNPTTGFELEQKYRLGLAQYWSAARWWTIGSKAEVFRQDGWRIGSYQLLSFREHSQLSRHDTAEPLPLVLANECFVEIVP